MHFDKKQQTTGVNDSPPFLYLAAPMPIFLLFFQTSCVKCPVVGLYPGWFQSYFSISLYHMSVTFLPGVGTVPKTDEYDMHQTLEIIRVKYCSRAPEDCPRFQFEGAVSLSSCPKLAPALFISRLERAWVRGKRPSECCWPAKLSGPRTDRGFYAPHEMAPNDLLTR